MNIQEGNKLIAEFMGKHIPPQARHGNMNFWQYHKSWNHLMPVVEKIGYKAYVAIETRATAIEDKGNVISLVLGTSENPTMLDNTYKTVIEFIKWYNKNK